MKKIISKTLCWVLVCAMVLAQFLIPMPLQTHAASAVREADTNVQNGTTLHCWNWSYANILENLPTIAAQGFTSIQVSPIQKAKQPTMGSPVNDWWTFYQPAEFAIDNTGVNAMGTKAEFMNLCEAAHEYGIYVIVDVVANHMAADYNYSRSPAIIDDIRNDNSCWHNKNSNIYNYSSRENITQYDLDSVLDLNTGSKKVQNYVLNYLKELIDAGADGFRFDAVKHIETPDDNASIASDFWPTVIYGAEEYATSKGLDLYCYGELLDHPDDVNGLPDSAYSKYYSITDNVWGNNVRDSVVAAGNAGNFGGTYHKNVSADNLVIWAESHDTYAGGNSGKVSESNINKTWALVAARANAMSLYLTRTTGFTPPNMLGTAYLSGWNVPEVAAVNKFHKAFIGQSEYVANYDTIAYVERGTSGAVLVNVGGNGTSVNVPANRLANGTYKDQISGNTFRVSGGKITGNIGSSGIAVIYNVSSCSHKSHYIAGLCTVCGASVSHSYSGGVCACGKTKPVTSGCTHAEHRYNGVCRDCGSNVGHSYSGGVCTVCGVEQPVDTFAYYLVGFINGSNVNEIKEEYRFKNGKLTLSSSSDAWISVRTYNGIFYQTSPDQQYNDTVTLRNASMSGGSNAQMRVPGGKTVTLHLQSNYNGTYTLSYAEGGIVAPDVPAGNANDYYLVGYINGANHGCEEDYSNLGNYKFTDGKLTATFDQDSYVFVKNGDNSKWLLADSYCQDTTCTFSEGKSEKMFVPGGVELTFTLTKNSNGSVTVSYTTAGGNSGSTEPVTTSTVYVDITGSGWSKVNVYTWDAAGTATTGQWPGSAMTKVSGSIYSYEVPSNAVNIIFNNGSSQTDDLTIPTNGKNQYNYKSGSWSTYTTACSHSYTSKVTTAATCDKTGVKTFTCSKCGDSYTESIAALGHNYVSGTCSKCGAKDPNYVAPGSTVYYLVGWINGADHGCESDWENMGNYQFVNGKLVATFNQDSYIFVKTEGNGKWLLAESYCESTSCTFVEGGTEKMFVPGNTALTFTLKENNDGSVTVSYTKGGTTACSHSYTSKVTTAATCTTAGVKTYTCSKCGNIYSETIPATGHHFVSGTCTSCGLFDGSTALVNTYYLVGWINNANYGCEEDYENNGIYKFVNGQLTAKFDSDSYLFVKTENNGKWLLADRYCTDTTCTFVEGGTEKMFVPGGVQLFFSIIENEDGSVTVSYTKGGTTSCDHSYNAEVTTEATCTTIGLRTYTCTKCGHSYTQNIAATGHNFFGGSCSVCGVADPSGTPSTGTAYYLVGYINGADHGCEDDWQNLGNYRFEGGRLTATFTQDSYVFVKTGDNKDFLLAPSYCEASTCTFAVGNTEKMFVPGGVKLTFTLKENTDGTVSVTYTSGSTPASAIPTLTLKSPTLEFKDMICINAFYTAENTQDVVEMGMITYTSKVDRWSVRTAEHIIPGATYVESSGRYYSGSQGIHAKYLADTFYLATYAKLADGSYVYSKLAPYSPMTYANSQLKNATDVKLKQLAVAMLNYGAEAQLYFGHNTGNLANAALNAEHLALPEAYRADMIAAVPTPSATKQGSFANNQGFASRKPAISFEGAFCINYFFTPKYAPASGITLYYWNAEDYNAVSVLKTSNATGSIKLSGSGTGEYRGDITGISAKALSEAVYVAAVYKNGSTTWTSGVLGYSIGSYCSSQASKGGSIANLAMATAVYGYHAKAYFG